MAPQVTLICPNCDHPFLRDAKYHTRNIKADRVDLCSRKCVVEFRNRRHFGPTIGFGFYANLCRKRAAKKGLEMTLTAESLRALFHSQQGLCALSNLPMTLNATAKKLPDKSPYYASVDRIDNSKGYVDGNVQFVCLGVNYMRNTFDTETTKAFIEALRK